MASVDPLLPADSVTRFLPRTLGTAAYAASPSRALGSLADGVTRPLRGSEDLVEQARLAMKKSGDIGKLYQDDGVNVAAAAAANGNNNQQGRRPALDRKRARFTLKAPASNTVQNVDFSELSNIEDPVEYFSTLEQLEKADKEIKRLRGEVPTETTDNHRPIDPPKMRPGMSRRKSVHSYKFSVGSDIPNAIETSASQLSQLGTIAEPQITQDDVHASVPERTKQPVHSRSSQSAILGASTREDSFAEKDQDAAFDYLLKSFKSLDDAEEENVLWKTFQLKEISIGKVCLPDFTVPADRLVNSTAVLKNPMSGHTPESPVSGSHLARFSQWGKCIFNGDALKDKYADLLKDDESDGSPEIVVGKRLLVQSSSDVVVLTTGEASTARETPCPSIKSPDHDLEPESNGVSTAVRQPENYPLGTHRDSGVAKGKQASTRNDVPLEADGTPMGPNNLEEVPPPNHLGGVSTEVLGRAPSRNVCPVPQGDANFEPEDVVGGDGLLQDEPIRTLEIPPEDIGPQHQPYMHEKSPLGTSNKISTSQDSGEKTVRKGKSKKQAPKRGKRVSDEPSHPQEMSSTNSDAENRPDLQDTDVEQQTAGTSKPRSPNNGKGKKVAQRGKKKQKLNSRQSLADAGLLWQSDGSRRSTRIRSRPLQHWLGERFIYGRIHETMATVIGVKSYSPSQEGKAAMRVKSFVPEQYSDIVAASAKY